MKDLVFVTGGGAFIISLSSEKSSSLSSKLTVGGGTGITLGLFTGSSKKVSSISSVGGLNCG